MVAAVLIAGPTLAPTKTAAEKIAATAARRFVWMVADVILSSFGLCSFVRKFVSGYAKGIAGGVPVLQNCYISVS